MTQFIQTASGSAMPAEAIIKANNERRAKEAASRPKGWMDADCEQPTKADYRAYIRIQENA